MCRKNKNKTKTKKKNYPLMKPTKGCWDAVESQKRSKNVFKKKKKKQVSIGIGCTSR